MRRRKSAPDIAWRSRTMLECAPGVSNSEVSRPLGIPLPTVGKWRSRFIDKRLDGLVYEPRPGRPATISIGQVEQVIIDTLESTPGNATHGLRASILNPPESAVVLSVDEKSQVQAL